MMLMDQTKVTVELVSKEVHSLSVVVEFGSLLSVNPACVLLESPFANGRGVPPTLQFAFPDSASLVLTLIH